MSEIAGDFVDEGGDGTLVGSGGGVGGGRVFVGLARGDSGGGRWEIGADSGGAEFGGDGHRLWV